MGETVAGFEVVVAAGSLRAVHDGAKTFPHRWTEEGVTVEADFTGAHLLHLAIAGCVLNDVYREAIPLGITIAGVRVIAAGGFDTETWQSTGVEYTVEVSSTAGNQAVERLLERVDDVAEIPRTFRGGGPVRRIEVQA